MANISLHSHQALYTCKKDRYDLSTLKPRLKKMDCFWNERSDLRTYLAIDLTSISIKLYLLQPICLYSEHHKLAKRFILLIV